MTIHVKLVFIQTKLLCQVSIIHDFFTLNFGPWVAKSDFNDR